MADTVGPWTGGSPVDPWRLERLLSSEADSSGPDSALLPLIAALRGPAAPVELAGEAVAVSRYRAARGRAGQPHVRDARRRTRVAVAVAMVGAVAFAGLTTAYAGVLPTGLQDLAHRIIGAPSAAPTNPAVVRPGAPSDSTAGTKPAGTPGAVGTSAAGSAGNGVAISTALPSARPAQLHGLCVAFLRGQLPAGTVGYRTLQAAAGSGGVAALCTSAANPSAHTRSTVPSRGSQATTHPTPKSSPGQAHQGGSGRPSVGKTPSAVAHPSPRSGAASSSRPSDRSPAR
jgi:hypothetical protein